MPCLQHLKNYWVIGKMAKPERLPVLGLHNKGAVEQHLIFAYKKSGEQLGRAPSLCSNAIAASGARGLLNK